MGLRLSYEKTMLTLAERTTSGASNMINVESFIEGILFVRVTAKGGTTPVLKVYVESSPDKTNWSKLGELADITDVGNYNVQLSNFGKTIRVKYEIAGTSPTFTFEAIYMGKS